MTGGQFKKGLKPWNKDKKGIHLSPATEFKKGRDGQRYKIGTVRQRVDRGGHPRAWIKTAEPNTWMPRAQLVWEEAHGPLAKGLVLHHIDRDTLNDNITNLAAISRAAHLMEHRHEHESKRLDGLRRKRNPRRTKAVV